MKTIVRIARTELGLMFYSPVAWLVLIIFSIQSAVHFTDSIEIFVRRARFSKPDTIGLTSLMTSGIFGFFTHMAKNLYLYVPLLTMGLVSREISSDSIKLLYSSPVKIRQIILGKYLAIITYGLILIAPVFIIVLAANSVIISADLHLMLSGLLGLYLLICAYTAIGLFMSCLSSYQVVAAITTFVTLAALNYISEIGQNVSLFQKPDFHFIYVR